MTKIEWTEEVWNPVTGCTKVSPGCAHCYAERMAKRLAGRCGYPADKPFAVTLHPERLELPLQWRKPRRVFVNSMSDLFHKDVPDEFIDQVFATMALAPWHTYQILTKRPERMLQWFSRPWEQWNDPILSWRLKPGSWPLPNVWLGVSVENQRYADERIPLLLQTPAAVRFLSCEPLLEAVHLGSLAWVCLPRPVAGDWPIGHTIVAEAGIHKAHVNPQGAVSAELVNGRLGIKPSEMHWCRKIDWVIAGGESGPGARPMHPDWVRALRDQCQAASVPFFFKQWGQWIPDEETPICRVCGCTDEEGCPEGCWWVDSGSMEWDLCSSCFGKPLPELRPMLYDRVGKKAAGAELDGRLWREMPVVK